MEEVYDETKWRGVLGVGYENFNYKELALTTSEDSVTLTDLEDNEITARAVVLFCPKDCTFMLNAALPATPPVLESDLYFTLRVRVTSIAAKVASGTSTLYIYYVW